MNIKPKSFRLPILDLLRFLAAFSVMLMHLFQRGFPGDKFYSHSFYLFEDVFKYNYLAVNLFFLISGYVIFLTAQNRGLKQFITSRFLRLYPAYWIACSLSFVVSYYFLYDIFQPTFSRYAFNMTMLNGFWGVGYIDGVYWTLLVELKFYILTMLLIFFKLIDKSEKILWLWLAISCINYFLNNHFLRATFITDYSSFFCMGALLFIISTDNFRFSLNRACFIIVAFTLGFFTEKQSLSLREQHFHTEYSWLALLGILIFLLAIFIIAISYKNVPKFLSQLFERLGKLSYPLYLIHLNIALSCYRFFAPDGSHRHLIGVILVIFLPIVAYLIAIYFEEPLRYRLKALINKVWT